MTTPDPEHAAAGAGSDRGPGDQEPAVGAGHPDGAGDEATWRALAQTPGAGGPVASVLRSGVLRRQGEGHITGVCAALAHAGGLPVRLVRIAAIGLLALGIGLPAYLVLALVLPRERRVGDGEDHREVDVPLRSLLRGRPGRGDALVALSLVPALVASYLWIVLFLADGYAPLRILVPVVAVFLGVLVWAALRARRARTAYLFAQLGRRAGVLDEQELARTVEDLRRYAPRAWDALRPAVGAAPTTPRGGARSRSRVRPPRLSARIALVLVAALLALATASFTLVSLFPFLAPGLGDARPLPGVGRVGAAAATVSVAAGILLVIIGLLRRRSVAVTVAGLLAITLFAGSVVWVRMTDSSGTAPLVIDVDTYSPGAIIACDDEEGAGSWDRDLVIDLSRLDTPTDVAGLQAQWQQQNSGASLDAMTLGMTVTCDRLVGDVTVILPPAKSSIPVESDLTTALGRVEGDSPPVAMTWTSLTVGIDLQGRLGAGDIVYREAE